jgi:undecaprenyl-diphosphatase
LAPERAERGQEDADEWPPAAPEPGPLALVVAKLLGAALVLGVLLFAAGQVLTPTPALDQRAERWFAHHRTAAWNTVTDVGSHIGSTPAIVAAAAVAFVVLRLWLHRWYESMVLVVTVAGEVSIFLALTATVDRNRPDVPQLDAAPPTSSFPSGHTAAATAFYLLVAYLALRYARHVRAGIVVAAIAVLVPFAVAVSRLYRGMHYPTDVLGGMLLGGLWLIGVLVVLMPPAWRSLHRELV